MPVNYTVFVLKMKLFKLYRMLVSVYQSTWHNIPEDLNLQDKDCILYCCDIWNIWTHVHYWKPHVWKLFSWIVAHPWLILIQNTVPCYLTMDWSLKCCNDVVHAHLNFALFQCVRVWCTNVAISQ